MPYILATREEVTLTTKEAPSKGGTLTIQALTEEGKQALADEVITAVQEARLSETSEVSQETIVTALLKSSLFKDAIHACHDIQAAADPISQGDLPNGFNSGVISRPAEALEEQGFDYFIMYDALKQAASEVEKSDFRLKYKDSANAFYR